MDRLIQGIRQKVEILHRTALRPDQIETIFGGKVEGESYSDHVTYAVSAATELKDAVRLRYYSDRNVLSPRWGAHNPRQVNRPRDLHVFNRLGHIIVNPHDRFNTQALISTYTFPRYEDDLDVSSTKHGPCVNRDRKTLDEYVETLCQAAKQTTSPLRFGTSAHVPIFLLHGERGAGKTILQNYILSAYSERFDLKKIIWVRLNLTEITAFDEQIIDLVFSQAAKIVCRYYDRKSKYYSTETDKGKIPIDVDKVIEQLFDSAPKKTRERKLLFDRAFRMRDVFRQGGHPSSKTPDQKLSQSLVPTSLALKLWEAAVEAGYSFIVVLDGVDVLEATPAAKDRFIKIKQQIGLLRTADERSSFCLVICCRTNTFDGQFANSGTSPFGSSVPYERHWVAPVNLDDVLAARLDYIADEVPRIAEVDKWDTDGWDIHIKEFQHFLNEIDPGSLPGEQRSYLRRLQEVQGSNVRSKMQILQFRYYEFLQRRLRGRAYHVIEALLKGGNRFPFIPYSYSVGTSGTIIRNARDNGAFDSRFLPSIFRYPFVPGSSGELGTGLGGARTLGNTMAGLRVLQLVDATHERERHRRGVGAIKVEEVCEIMKKVFGVAERLVVLMLDEWVEYQIVEFTNDLTHSLADLDDEARMRNEVVWLPKVNMIAESLTREMTYLNLAAMRVLISERALSASGECDGNGTCPYFRASAYDEADDSIEEWMAAKIVNSVAMVRILRAADAEQAPMAEARISELSPRAQRILREALSRGMFRIGERAGQAVHAAIEPVLRGLSSFTDVEGILSHVDRSLGLYRNTWGRPPNPT